MISLDRCNGSCDAPDGLLSKIHILSKTENVNLNVFNMITRRNESKRLAKRISCNCKCKFDDRKYNSKQKLNK